MKLIIDDAHIDLIKEIYEFYPVEGVTTNPSILAKSGRSPYEVLREIREFIGEEGELHVQAVSRDAEGMIQEAHRITEELEYLCKNPVCERGIQGDERAAQRRNICYSDCCIYAYAGISGSKMRSCLCGAIH